jgi:peptide/nickel transport system substrate-binding protein
VSRQTYRIVGLMIVVLSLLAVGGCGTTPTPQVVEVEKTVVVQQTVVAPQTVVVEQTVVVPQEVVVTPTPEPAKPTGTLTLGMTAGVNTLDPFMGPELNIINVVHHINEALLFLADDGTIQPGLAESWENLDDTTWRLKLRQGVTFTNGEPFNADAVIFSWKYSQQPDMLQKWGFASIADIVAEDAYTIKVTTTSPDPLFLMRLADMGWIVPPKYIEEKGKEYFAEHPIGTGPFKLAEWVKGDHVTLEANTGYWLPGVPKVEKLVFMAIPEAASRVAALKAGQIDFVYRLESQFVPDLLFDQSVKVLRFTVPRVYDFGFNLVNPGKGTPIDNEKVRQALAYALDMQTIIDRVMEGNGVRINGPIGNNDFGHDPSVVPFPYDVEKAKALLAEAGYPNGFEIDMGGPAGAYARGTELCEAAVGYWAKIGVKVNLTMIESGKYWDDAIARKYPPIFFDSWSVRTGDAAERIEGLLLKDGSYSNYYDPEVEDLVTRIGQTVDVAKRKALLSDLQKMLQVKVPVIGMFEPYGFQAITDRVQGYTPRGAETLYFWNISVR